MRYFYIFSSLLLLPQLVVAQSPTISCAQVCTVDDLVFEDVPLEDSFFCAQGIIEIATDISNGQEVTFLSGDRIMFKPGFKIMAGSKMDAFTDNCTLSAGFVEAYSTESPEFSFEIAPNPVFYEGQIAITLPEAAEVSIRLTDINGRITHTLVHGKLLAQGGHQIPFDIGKFPAGVYFASLHIHGDIHTKPILVAK